MELFNKVNATEQSGTHNATGTVMTENDGIVFHKYEMERQERERESKKWFEILGPASLVYALIYTFCSYHNTAGIAISIWIGAQIGYVAYVMKKLEMRWKKGSSFLAAVMLLLGISSFLTGNGYLHFMNYVANFILIIVFLLHNFYDTKEWGVDKMLLEVMAALIGAIGEIVSPFEELAAFVRLHDKKKGNRTGYAVTMGLVIAIPLLLVAGLCLGSADAVFAHMFDGIAEMISVSDMEIKIPFMLVFGFFSAYCGTRYVARRKRSECDLQYKKHSSLIAITFSSALAFMYVLFSGIQIIYLFLGYGNLPENMTYASYARTGFFQLLFVIAMNLCLVLLTRRAFQESKVLKAILMIICLCTFVMIASSCYRMLLYIHAYHLTFLRVFVLVTLAIFTLLMAGVVRYLQKESFHLFRYSLVVVSVVYLSFSFSHVDYWIASYNLEHMTEKNRTDIQCYFGSLSSDAASVIQNYVENDENMSTELAYAKRTVTDLDDIDQYDRNIRWYIIYQDNIKANVQDMGIRNFNLSYCLAKKLVLGE